jgi:DNA-binding GntR family transcriptional regulator
MATDEALRRPVSAHDVALREIRQLILTGGYQPGAQIAQEQIAVRLGISVIPVREALKSLEGEGQVVFVARRGYFVTKFSREDLVEICSIRSALEGIAVRQGAADLSAKVFQDMAKALTDMRDADAADDVLAFVEADRRFHFALLRPGCGPQLVRLLTWMWDQSDHYRAAYLSHAEHRRSNHDEHAAILRAAEDRTAERIVRLLDAHRLTPLSTVEQGA